MFLEVIATSVDDCLTLNEQAKIIDRIELCVNLKKGGFTPTMELVEDCLKISKIPINIMLRTTKHFTLKDSELDELKGIVKYIKQNFAHLKAFNGFVFGAINNDKKLNIDAMKEMVQLVLPYQLVCHRCFEKVINKDKAIVELEKMGVKEILYSAITVEEISKIKSLPSKKVQFLIGGGVNFTNKVFLLKNNLKRLHIGSCIRHKDKWSEPINGDKIQEFVDLK
ncbi:copper homeostasis protein CutC [Mycoplasma sp. SG1]|uniref:copper homeostasis protein CutC n=1 Tax=Mycoplasma sp. SG1 TaxID=2810348 RepID=UPI00202533CA|nr:copper homeostasis protein CutC [Mycoplasma sp. SG1]URM52945.1 hypothetical protein JRW51_01190 [Mycoplasma sp. SG1]